VIVLKRGSDVIGRERTTADARVVSGESIQHVSAMARKDSY
jgi:hypothetical protein